MSKPDIVKVVIRLSPDKYLLRDDPIVKNDETSIKKTYHPVQHKLGI